MLFKESESKLKDSQVGVEANKKEMILVKTLFDSREFFFSSSVLRFVITFLSENHWLLSTLFCFSTVLMAKEIIE